MQRPASAFVIIILVILCSVVLAGVAATIALRAPAAPPGHGAEIRRARTTG
jgi:hypothetical protein